ncbi:MAG: DUF3784 domain-containing protein [Bacteroidales bacterium]|nr:DUF3784 domain-containing protein [Bacteroidales bacterium]
MEIVIDIVVLKIGLIMIGVGFLVKSAPGLIAGYNTMPKEKKAQVDIKGLSTFMRNALILIGLVLIAGYFLFKWLGLPVIANSLLLFVPLFGSAIAVIKAQKFDHNKDKKTKLPYIIIGAVLLFVTGLITYGFIPSKVYIDAESVRFSGMYGTEIPVTRIDSIYLADRIPEIKIRTNGYSFGGIKKGFFYLDEWGNNRLLMHSGNPPYLIVAETTGRKTILTFKDKSKTERTYNDIFNVLNSP